MSKATFINLDELSEQAERTVKFKGQTYKIEDFSLRQFIQFQRSTEALDKAIHAEDPEKVSEAIEALVTAAIPDIPAADVAKITPAQASAIIQMVNNVYPTPDQSEVNPEPGNAAQTQEAALTPA